MKLGKTLLITVALFLGPGLSIYDVNLHLVSDLETHIDLFWECCLQKKIMKYCPNVSATPIGQIGLKMG